MAADGEAALKAAKLRSTTLSEMTAAFFFMT
jgi:hypothetical protein